MKSLRRQLFTSHLLVMFVALGVVLAGVITAVVVASLFTGFDFDSGRSGPTPRRGSQPVGPLVLLVPVIAAAGASALVSWQVARRLAAPIEATRLASRQLASGRYDVQVDGGSITELADLAADVNQLGAELRATEQRRLRLVGDVAHELRNPLATIEASMEALMDGVAPATDETFAGIGREASRLRRLARDLSELSATAEPSAVSIDQRIEISSVLTHVVDQIAPQAAVKDLDLQWRPADPMYVAGDRDRLVQVFTNIIGNAVQYTRAGRIVVDASLDSAPQPHSVVVTITDTGIGLSNEDQILVFERFHRVDQGLEGSGVGLAIAKSLVEAHNGTIEAVSDGLGCGSKFTVRLPSYQISDKPSTAQFDR